MKLAQTDDALVKENLLFIGTRYSRKTACETDYPFTR
jgi:hypothetical protein